MHASRYCIPECGAVPALTIEMHVYSYKGRSCKGQMALKYS